MSIPTSSAAAFEQQLLSGGLTLVDFGAPWCPPCRALLPVLEQLGDEFAGQLNVLQLNVDETPELSARFGVLSMPTVILFKNGQPVEKLVGLRPKQVYAALLKKHA
ncbi:thioredoxin family protein [Paenibacillus aurantius]|uniref:Thioredoxin n=1 Tax=Paenibacillus aurantius TaxID=2918900 RepID=A0AA96LI54_9BACL|nr:thioredoxin family protein [Paenibacillus aurantius]WNQ12560.1 thioredoxin family protein [Paenibacillus aurantius]